jgi:maltose/moltooligosaccharide transporter
VFGADNPNAPLYMVTLGGGLMLLAAACVGLVRDVGAPEPSGRVVLAADAREALGVQGSAQPVPSSGPTA